MVIRLLVFFTSLIEMRNHLLKFLNEETVSKVVEYLDSSEEMNAYYFIKF